MKYILFSATLFLSCQIGSAFAQAGMATFAVDQSVSSATDQLKDAAEEVIHNAGNEFGRGAFTARQNAEILIQQLNVIATELEGKTFKDLNESQRLFFVNTRNTLDEMRNTTDYSVARAQQLVSQADNMLGTLPGSNRTARVLDFSPRYVLSTTTPAPVVVSINGSWLGTGEPTLVAAGKACTRLQKTEVKLMFSCNLSNSSALSNLDYAKLNLVTFDRKSWWDSLVELFGGHPKKRNYELAVAVVPRTIGAFSGFATVKKAVIEERNKEQLFRNDNEHCQDTRTYNWTANIDSNDGWRLSAQPSTMLLSDSDATNEGIQGWSATGFTLQGKAKNNGSCAPRIFGHRAYVDGRGHVAIRANWVETRTTFKEVEVPIELGDIQWGVEKSTTLPEGASFASVKSKLINGKSFEDTSNDAAIRHWYRVSFDIKNRRVLIRPQELETALSLN